MIGIAIFALSAIAGAGIWIFSPFQDRSSSAYHAWKNGHDANARHQNEMIARLVDESFRLDSLDLIYVSAGKAYFSWWGHILLRLRGSGATPDDDVVVSFLADFADFPVSRWKASFGGYEVLPRLVTYREAAHEYIQGENRSFTPYLLVTTPEQLSLFLRTLRLWAQNPATPGTYTFFNHNCAGLVSHLLRDSQVLSSEQGPFPIFPSKLVSLLLKIGVLKERG